MHPIQPLRELSSLVPPLLRAQVRRDVSRRAASVELPLLASAPKVPRDVVDAVLEIEATHRSTALDAPGRSRCLAEERPAGHRLAGSRQEHADSEGPQPASRSRGAGPGQSAHSAEDAFMKRSIMIIEATASPAVSRSSLSYQ